MELLDYPDFLLSGHASSPTSLNNRDSTVTYLILCQTDLKNILHMVSQHTVNILSPLTSFAIISAYVCNYFRYQFCQLLIIYYQ